MDRNDNWYYNPSFPSSDYGGVDDKMIIKAPPQRRRLNTPAVIWAVLIPYGCFLVTCAFMTFSVHYYHPLITGVLITLAFVLSISLSIKAFAAWKGSEDEEVSVVNYNPSWYLFLACTCMLAVTVGTILGEACFTQMAKYFDVKDLGKANGLDPTTASGKAYMDSGIILWSNSTVVDTSLAIGFKDKDVYCVAPLSVNLLGRNVVNAGPPLPLASYDFWVAGTNCCNGYPKDFGCGLNTLSLNDERSGLRIMDSSKLLYYRLAVQQAEVEFGIHAEHPLFFSWLEDPESVIDAYFNAALTGFAAASTGYLLFQVLLVAIALWWYTKQERQMH